jgi:hypothetical protein
LLKVKDGVKLKLSEIGLEDYPKRNNAIALPRPKHVAKLLKLTARKSRELIIGKKTEIQWTEKSHNHLISSNTLFARGWTRSLIDEVKLTPKGKILIPDPDVPATHMDEDEEEFSPERFEAFLIEIDGYLLKEVREAEKLPEVAEKLKANRAANQRKNLKAFEERLKKMEQDQQDIRETIWKGLKPETIKRYL